MTMTAKIYPILEGIPDTDSNGEGYIKLWRTLFYKGWYKKSEYVHLWLHILMKATHKGMETWFDGQTIKLKPGQFVTGRKKLANETGINESKVERILKLFQNEQQIEQVSTNTSRLISISNWAEYQKREQPNEQRMNNKRTTDEQQMNTKQECKNDKKVFVAAATQQTSFKNWTEDDFKNELSKHLDFFGRDMLNAFFKYWSEKSATGRMKFQLEKTWETKKRLENWQRIDEQKRK
jgi:hypothetical protein